jgi:hypothetical protein
MPICERTCTAKNRVRELRSPGSVRDEGSNVLVYSDRRYFEVAGMRVPGFSADVSVYLGVAHISLAS